MANELLLDTSAFVAILDRSQSLHRACADFYRAWDGPVATTEAVLTECTHLVAGISGGRTACLDFILKGGAVLVPSTDISLRRCRELMEKYRDLPMDFADATIVVLAEELNTDQVFTVDRDFLVYRIRGRKPFRVLPARASLRE